MRIPPILAIGLIGAAVAIVAALWDEHKPAARLHAKRRPLLSPLEQLMYARLREAFPHLLVVPKVGLGAMLTTTLAERARLRHRMVDFALCDSAFEVRAVIELDEETAPERHAVGEAIVELAAAAGYAAREYRGVPGVAELQAHWPALAAGAPAGIAPVAPPVQGLP